MSGTDRSGLGGGNGNWGFELSDLLRNENFDEAVQFMGRLKLLNRPELQPLLDFGQQVTDFNYGRYYQVVASLQNSTSLRALNMLEAYEHVGYTEPAEQAYRDAIASSEYPSRQNEFTSSRGAAYS